MYLTKPLEGELVEQSFRGEAWLVGVAGVPLGTMGFGCLVESGRGPQDGGRVPPKRTGPAQMAKQVFTSPASGLAILSVEWAFVFADYLEFGKVRDLLLDFRYTLAPLAFLKQDLLANCGGIDLLEHPPQGGELLLLRLAAQERKRYQYQPPPFKTEQRLAQLKTVPSLLG